MAATTKKLYAMAATLGLLERGSEEDAFHQLVYGLTGKEHVSELSPAEANAVQRELQCRLRSAAPNVTKKRSRKKDVSGMMTAAQQKKAWSLIYRLDEIEPKEVPEVERLIGAIEKVLGITASRVDPFRWINFDDGTKLIEQLKRYVRSAERKAAKAGANNGYR